MKAVGRRYFLILSGRGLTGLAALSAALYQMACRSLSPSDQRNQDLGPQKPQAGASSPPPPTSTSSNGTISVSTSPANPNGGAVEMQNLRIVSLFRDTGVLTTAMLAVGEPVSFPHWDGDGHLIVVTKDHLAALKRGQKVEFKTTVANYHDHSVVIDPKVVVVGSPKVSVPV